MTTATAAALYEAQHNHALADKGYAVFNPLEKPVSELPVIYGFNNGGSAGWYSAALLAEDGTGLGSHICSAEAYMRHDLGILEGCRPDRHERFQKHYPEGYRMDFVGAVEVRTGGHAGLESAYQLNQAKGLEAKTETKEQEL
jgi:hypothetical protein